MFEFVAIWSQVLDETIGGVIHFFKESFEYLDVDYTKVLLDVNPKKHKGVGNE